MAVFDIFGAIYLEHADAICTAVNLVPRGRLARAAGHVTKELRLVDKKAEAELAEVDLQLGNSIRQHNVLSRTNASHAPSP